MTAHKIYNNFKRLHYKNATMHGDILGKNIAHIVIGHMLNVIHRGSSASETDVFIQQIEADSEAIH